MVKVHPSTWVPTTMRRMARNTAVATDTTAMRNPTRTEMISGLFENETMAVAAIPSRLRTE